MARQCRQLATREPRHDTRHPHHPHRHDCARRGRRAGCTRDSAAPSTANPVNGIPSGVYPISGTRAWLSADDSTLSFAAPQVALGFYGADIGDFNGRLTLELVVADTSSLLVPASRN